MSSVQQARIQKTRFWFSDREGFLELLARDLASFQGVQFYDYTKVAKRLGSTPENFYLTFSRSETSEPQAPHDYLVQHQVMRSMPITRRWDTSVASGNNHAVIGRVIQAWDRVPGRTGRPHPSGTGP